MGGTFKKPQKFKNNPFLIYDLEEAPNEATNKNYLASYMGRPTHKHERIEEKLKVRALYQKLKFVKLFQ